MFALANGHIGLRGNLDEGEPFGLPGTHLNAFYELRPLPYAEAGYGYPESGQTVVNAIGHRHANYQLICGEPLEVTHHGDPITASTKNSVSRPIPSVHLRKPPGQPLGRAPARRRPPR